MDEPSLLSLPDELLSDLVHLLDQASLVAVSSVCTRLSAIAMEARHWKDLRVDDAKEGALGLIRSQSPHMATVTRIEIRGTSEAPMRAWGDTLAFFRCVRVLTIDSTALKATHVVAVADAWSATLESLNVSLSGGFGTDDGTDECLSEIGEMPSLRRYCVVSTSGMSPPPVARWPVLEELELTGVFGDSHEIMEAAVAGHPSIISVWVNVLWPRRQNQWLSNVDDVDEKADVSLTKDTPFGSLLRLRLPRVSSVAPAVITTKMSLFPSLVMLHLEGYPGRRDDLYKLLRVLPCLVGLDLPRAEHAGDVGFYHAMSEGTDGRLRYICVRRTAVDDACLEAICGGLFPALRSLSLANCSSVSDEGLARLVAAKRDGTMPLETLNLYDCFNVSVHERDRARSYGGIRVRLEPHGWSETQWERWRAEAGLGVLEK